MVGKRMSFDFHVYWYPEKDTFELRTIGNLRPPNELVERASKIAEQRADGYRDLSNSDPVRIGLVTVAFAQFPNEPEKNYIIENADSFEEKMETQNEMNMIGDPVAAEYRKANAHFDSPDNNYAPYKEKGWLKVNGEYYPPDDEKPEGWSSH